jgi:hypothetical protein
LNSKKVGSKDKEQLEKKFIVKDIKVDNAKKLIDITRGENNTLIVTGSPNNN